MTIKLFSGYYSFLSNFYSSSIIINHNKYSSVEHAYQAFKTLDNEAHEFIRESDTPGEAKKRGRKIELRSDWEDIKISVMTHCIMQKFAQFPLRDKLIETYPHELIEGNNWGDTYWGMCDDFGQNQLGKILMFQRSLLIPL
jgi:ribA/ribD-fused uncharacterized protein